MVPFNYTKKSPNTYTIILNYFSSEEQLIFESLFLFLLCWLIALELVPERKTFPKIDDSFHLCILISRGPFTSTTKPGRIFPFLPIFFNLATSMTEPPAPSAGEQNRNHRFLLLPSSVEQRSGHRDVDGCRRTERPFLPSMAYGCWGTWDNLQLKASASHSHDSRRNLSMRCRFLMLLNCDIDLILPLGRK